MLKDEYIIVSQPELKQHSRLYMKQARKILNELHPELLEAYKKMRAQQIANAEASESSDADEDGDLVDNLFHLQSFGSGPNDESHAANLLKHFESHDEITKEQEEDMKASEKEVEKLEKELEETDEKNDITKTYKLFNYIASQEPE